MNVSCRVLPNSFMKTIPLSQGQVAIIDDEDFNWVNQYKWSFQRNRRTGYAVRSVKYHGKQTRSPLHREVLGLGPGDPEVDHRDGNGLNCTKDNLRMATRQQNQRNQRKHLGTSSQFKGVCWDKANRKWLAQIQVDGYLEYLGRFDAELTAARAYNLAAVQAFGEFAQLNRTKFLEKS